ncbi:MAG TPA: tRNA (adenosine(37)-N6)-dimethylallyltransferase MiaA [Candidatus Paceibacterota bacterium]|jgi:tRNA dimethylallyltransferase|nr:tRNA (adenosine(37)-N6)-dimethylallyltransferase MiaA [Candidatus Paceibacterota bacterium]HOH11249.1 tRNA (adenosine(37)-N6)-dimethylallyltransferase MiaA [Candidatus Paceibacterota bacterium]HOY11163.1 tRNA (adenosine(37)-N6)-dimethylallyltransferase MiaA [Candidatus Paceibacterota bacterium]HPI24593.1 tRNA (adenosine(37)-N6)-dimethylallyltransferase MiaA [Candidatus Paceibacterota bacterium]HPN89341.1 tRNA (adenosine(37)-N6)-dimethylallyltransferase MiaA [Candidatus Paceibacterota bacteri
MSEKPKIVVILGPTASGKTALSIKVAQKIGGEVISADSRQVYKGLDLGTGKVTKKEMGGVPHHLLDVASPKRKFSVARYQKLANKKITEIIKRGRTPIIVGGSGFYIQAIVDNLILPDVPPNPKLRLELQGKTIHELFSILKKIDPQRAKNIDENNPVRLIRAIEIGKAFGQVPKLQFANPPFNFIQIGLKPDSKDLEKKIKDRLLARMRLGLVAEVKKLHRQGLSWRRMEELGLEYRYLALLEQKKTSREQMIKELEKEIVRYAKRQITWFKRDKRISWFNPTDKKLLEKVLKLINEN